MKLELRLLNGFLLVIPLLLWNLYFAPRLTQASFISDQGVPAWILVSENLLRIAVLALPLLMPLTVSDRLGKAGLVVWLAGTLIYCGAWLPLIYRPESVWSTSIVGLMAPYLTPLIWLIGIGLASHSWLYVLLSALFVLLHGLHGLQSFKFTN